ncbi:MAG: LPS export ABC transporter periplasmic protein LptC [Proteobacteria bacterium]|nr:LPS export ABC transporter periplasmic protein LptC [Pseudomonadota bacterium]
MAVELHLPDLPEVPLSLSLAPAAAPAQAPRRRPWHLRLGELLSTYLPLLLMALLALSTWWLVKNTPLLAPAPASTEQRRDPDYLMNEFAIERFDAGGRLRVRVDGLRLQHFPATDHYEIDQARIRAIGVDGKVTVAVADRALANGDISELQLFGGAKVTSTGPQGEPVEIRSEFLHAFLVTEQVQTSLPVTVTAGNNELRAEGLHYDNGKRLLELKGRQRAWMAAPATPPRRETPAP